MSFWARKQRFFAGEDDFEFEDEDFPSDALGTETKETTIPSTAYSSLKKNEDSLLNLELTSSFVSNIQRFVYIPAAGSCKDVSFIRHDKDKNTPAACGLLGPAKADASTLDELDFADNICTDDFQNDRCNNGQDEVAETMSFDISCEDEMHSVCSSKPGSPLLCEMAAAESVTEYSSKDRRNKSKEFLNVMNFFTDEQPLKRPSDEREKEVSVKDSMLSNCAPFEQKTDIDSEALSVGSSALYKSLLQKRSCSTPIARMTCGALQSRLDSPETNSINSPRSPMFGFNLGGTCTSSRKRKFPGPAGLLPDRLAEGDASFLKQCKLPGMNISSNSSFDKGLVCSQGTAYMFQEAPWLNMIKSMSRYFDLSLLKHFNIKTAQIKASQKKLPKHIVLPVLGVILEKVMPTSSEAEATFRDETGDISGKISLDVMEKYESYLATGSVLFLKKAEFLCNQLIVKSHNIVAIYASDGRETFNNFSLDVPTSVKKFICADGNEISTSANQISHNAVDANKQIARTTSELDHDSSVVMDENYDDFLDDDMDDLMSSVDGYS